MPARRSSSRSRARQAVEMQPSLPSVVADRPDGRSEWMPSPTEHLHPASDRTKSVASTLAAPRAMVRMRRLTAGFLTLGSSPLATFPVSQWYPGHRLADYSCGGSRGLRPKGRTAFPFDPREGHRRPLDTVGMEGPSTGFRSPSGLQYCGDMTTETDETARHKAKMANRKAAQDAEIAAKTVKKGLLIVHTGKGKGKSAAAWGLL